EFLERVLLSLGLDEAALAGDARMADRAVDGADRHVLARSDRARTRAQSPREEGGEGRVLGDRHLRLLHRHPVSLTKGADGELLGGLSPLEPGDPPHQAGDRVLGQEPKDGDEGRVHHGGGLYQKGRAAAPANSPLPRQRASPCGTSRRPPAAPGPGSRRPVAPRFAIERRAGSPEPQGSSRTPIRAPSQASPSASFQLVGTGCFHTNSPRISAPLAERDRTTATISMVSAS